MEHFPEHWQQQLQMAIELRQNAQTAHRHSRKGGAKLAENVKKRVQADDPQRDGEQMEHHRATMLDDDPRQDWDGMDLSGQGLKCLSPKLFDHYVFLTKLYIDNNKISALPPSINSLRSLKHLQASNNQLRELPDTIGMLSKLEQILVFDNGIRTIPAEVGYLFRLEILGIEGNPLDEDTKDFLIQHGTQALVTHLRDSTEGSSTRLRLILF